MYGIKHDAFKANYIQPVVEAIGLLLPFVAQTLFAVAHLPDVVRQAFLLSKSREKKML